VFNPTALTWTTTTPVGRSSTVTLDTSGRLAQFAVPSVTPVVFANDAKGRLHTITQGTFTQGSQQVPRTWTMAYDANGYLASVTDPLQNAVSYHNDNIGRATDTFLPDVDGGTRDLQTGFDGDNDLTSVTMPRNPSQEQPGAHVPAALLHDYAEDVSQQLRGIEEALDALHVVARSMRRKAGRAGGQ
jgi:YD repeat-containing protein